MTIYSNKIVSLLRRLALVLAGCLVVVAQTPTPTPTRSQQPKQNLRPARRQGMIYFCLAAACASTWEVGFKLLLIPRSTRPGAF